MFSLLRSVLYPLAVAVCFFLSTYYKCFCRVWHLSLCFCVALFVSLLLLRVVFLCWLFASAISFDLFCLVQVALLAAFVSSVLPVVMATVHLVIRFVWLSVHTQSPAPGIPTGLDSASSVRRHNNESLPHCQGIVAWRSSRFGGCRPVPSPSPPPPPPSVPVPLAYLLLHAFLYFSPLSSFTLSHCVLCLLSYSLSRFFLLSPFSRVDASFSHTQGRYVKMLTPHNLRFNSPILDLVSLVRSSRF